MFGWVGFAGGAGVSRSRVVPLFSEGEADVVRLRRLLGLLEDASAKPVTFSREALERAGFTVREPRRPSLLRDEREVVE